MKQLKAKLAWMVAFVLVVAVAEHRGSAGSIPIPGGIPNIPGIFKQRGGSGGGKLSPGEMIQNGGKLLKDAADYINISPAKEDAYGQFVAASLLGRYPQLSNPAIEKYVTMVGLTVATGTTAPGGNYVFIVLNRSDVNAYSGPNGYILITSGALGQMKDEAELAGVLGHEMAHVIHHDGLKQLKAAGERGLLGDVMNMDRKGQQFAGLTQQGVAAITDVTYAQPQETAADQAAVEYLVAAGYDPSSYQHFLERIAQMDSPQLRLMSNHPSNAQRIQDIQNKIAQMNVSGGQTLANRFQASIRAR